MKSSVREDLFGEAIALPPQERQAFLARACGTDGALLAELLAIVSAHEGPACFIAPEIQAAASGSVDEGAGDYIGRYRLLQKIGEGGCGVVWMAEQREPVQRRVAVKVIKLGMDTKAVIARFGAERQALAMMDHPCIAKVYDAGSTPSGRPYFVMELVRGISITKFCDEHQLTPTARLELFIKVCHAIQHAHQKGVIHRDLKPSNILVTVNDGAPTPKVIDFGIAKATNGRLSDITLITSFDQFIGTPVYMSPEQAEMSSLDIDTRSDIYSLGVLLYELLTGRPPFDPKSFARAGVEKIRQQIREGEPRRPSVQWGTLGEVDQATAARQRGTLPDRLSGMLRGDLDWIVMRCLEKDRSRRYETANGLAMDLQRYLRNEPVSARPPSTGYLLQKLIRRHRFEFITGCTLIAIVLIGAILTATQATRALQAERREAQIREAAQQQSLQAEKAKLAAEEERQRNEKQRWVRQRVLPEIERLIEERDIAGAFDQAVEAEKYLPDDPALAALWPRIATKGSFDTDPPGAEVYAKPYLKPESPWHLVGTTPIKDVRMARTVHRWLIKKDGYATLERARIASGHVKVGLVAAEVMRAGMVYVGGKSIEAQPPSSAPETMGKKKKYLPTGDFFIDQYEVTNREYKAFIDRGGYATSAYWKQRFVKDGRELTWNEAMAEFCDATGSPGPSTWRNGTFPPGQDEHPVSGVSWFEAAAYAEFVGKRLPSIHHWMRIAPMGAEHQIQLANFGGGETIAVGQSRSLSMWGAYDLAGNVKEWCWNERETGLHYILGGSSREPAYVFDYPDAQSPWNRAEGHGFRCLAPLGDAPAPPELDMDFRTESRDFTTENPVTDEVFAAYKGLYSYEQSPLAPKLESVDENSVLWRKERVLINAAYGDERLPVVLFLPKNVAPPYQAVIYFPASGALNLRGDLEGESRIGFIVKSGRAVVYPIYKGTYERGEGDAQKYVHDPNIYPDFVIHCAKDLRRTIDYLEIRPDIQPERIGYIGRSLGAVLAPMLLAVEPRIRAAVLISGGIRFDHMAPHVEQVNFAPRVTIPVLMLNGKFDSLFPVPSQRQLLRALGTAPEHKHQVLIDGPHGIGNEPIEKNALPWLDQYLGKVK